MNMEEMIAKAEHQCLSAEECSLLREAVSGGERAVRELETVRRREKIGSIAAKYRFSEPDYLDFLAAKSGVDVGDEIQVNAFMGQLANSLPNFFTVELSHGSGAGGGGVSSERRTEPEPAERPAARRGMSDIARLIETAPDAD